MTEFAGGTQLIKRLGLRYRQERNDLETILWGDTSGHWLEPGLAALRDRSAAFVPCGQEVRRLAAEGQLGVSMDAWTWSLAHMHANRLLRSAARAQELVIHDFLERLYRGRLARGAR